jgi:hypothetical protein
MRERIISTGSINKINQPEIVSKKMNLWLKKYSKNLEIVRCSEKIFSNQKKKIFYIDNPTNTVLGNINQNNNDNFQEINEGKITILIHSFLGLINMIFALLLSSFKMNLNFTSIAKNKISKSTNNFDNKNNLNKDSLYFSDSNFSIYGLKGTGNQEQATMIRISLFLLFKLFYAFKIIQIFSAKEFWISENNDFLYAICYFLLIIISEISVKSIKLKFDKILKLDVNFIESRVYVKENNNFIDSLFTDKEKGNRRTIQKLADELNIMRVGGNVKKEFILNFFTKNVKNLSGNMNELGLFDKRIPKVFTGYRNEDMMVKKNGVFEYASSENKIGNFLEFKYFYFNFLNYNFIILVSYK